MAAKVRHVDGGGREQALAKLAERQHGVVARRQLLAMGVGERTIERWLAVGRLHSVNHGSYAVGYPRLSQPGRWLAAVLATDENALLSHASAVALLGLTRARGPIDVTSPGGNQGRRRWPGIRLHRCRLHDESEWTVRNGIPVTSVARTLFDYAEAVDYERLERACEEADRLKLLRIGALEQVCERGRGRHALRPVRRLIAGLHAAERTRSPLEDRFQAFLHHHRLPPPATNVLVLGHEVDALWPQARLVAELDSWEHHAHRAAFERDRARDPKLLLAGYRTIRVTHLRLDREGETLATEIRELLAQGQSEER